MVTRSYFLRLPEDVNHEQTPSKLAKMIVRVVPGANEQRSEDGEKFWVDSLPDRIIVRHRREVHENILRLLSNLRVVGKSSWGNWSS